MRKIVYVRFMVAIFAMIFLVGTIDTYSQRKPRIRRTTRTKANTSNFKVEKGTRIRVRLEDKLTSKSSQVGDRFTTTVREPVYSNTGVIVIPSGSTIIGQVDSVKKAK